MEHYSRAQWAQIAEEVHGDRLPGRPDQGVYEESEFQNFTLGSRRVWGERVFRYCKASANGCERPFWGAQNRNVYNAGTDDDCFEGDSTGDQAIGSTTLVIPDTNTDHGVNHFQNGWAVLFHAINTRIYRIKSSTASVGGSVTLTLWDAIAEATSGTFCTIHPSIYSKVERVHGGGSTKTATVCVPLIPVTANYYFWGQTWGPCYCTPSEAVPGTGDYERLLVFNYDGSIKLIPAHAAGAYAQIAGYLLEETTSADTFFCLTIAP